MKMPEKDRRPHSGNIDQITTSRVVTISIDAINKTIATFDLASTREETLGKKLVLGMEPINGINLLLNWHLSIKITLGLSAMSQKTHLPILTFSLLFFLVQIRKSPK